MLAENMKPQEVSQAIDQVSRWKEIIDETNPAGLVELDDLEIFLGSSGVCSAGCSNTSSACCKCNVASACC